MRREMCACVVLCAMAGGASGQLGVLDKQMYNGKVYVLFDNSNWTDAEARAEHFGGTLACINDSSEEFFVYHTWSKFGGTNRNLWIGYYDTDQTNNSTDRNTRRGEFHWVNGQNSSYANWSPLEPLNPQSGEEQGHWEYYVHIWQPSDPYGSTWNNYSNGLAVFGVPLHGVAEMCSYSPDLPGVQVCAPSQVSFTASPYGNGPFTYHWRKDGVAMDASSNASVTTATLVVNVASVADAGEYSCVVTNSCGTALGAYADLSVCGADFNCDGFVDFFDFNDFVTCFEDGQCPPGASADYNGDGFADFFDFNDFITAFEAGC